MTRSDPRSRATKTNAVTPKDITDGGSATQENQAAAPKPQIVNPKSFKARLFKPRAVILAEPHMSQIDDALLRPLSDEALAALEIFMAFCANEGVNDPNTKTFEAFAQVREGTDPDHIEEDLWHLLTALDQLGMPSRMISALKRARKNRARPTHYGPIQPGPLKSPRARKVSLPLEELPADWQVTLRRLRDEAAFSKSILDRMEIRLGMFAWSAQKAGLPIDLACAEARHAITNDLTERSIAQARKAAGVDKVDAPKGISSKTDSQAASKTAPEVHQPRYAYLRSTWEEMLRFAQAHGCSPKTVQALKAGCNDLSRREARQAALKMAKIQAVDPASTLLATAFDLLERAHKLKRPQQRHDARNKAVALAMGVLVPARAIDVLKQHIFGVGLFYELHENRYRFKYTPSKSSRDPDPNPLDLLLLADFTPLIDALILQDHDPAFLEALREAAFKAQRPLYVRADGQQCPYGWYTRAWAKLAGTGGHIARTLAYDEFEGEFGAIYGKQVNHHKTNRISAKYRSDTSKRKNIQAAQEMMKQRALSKSEALD